MHALRHAIAIVMAQLIYVANALAAGVELAGQSFEKSDVVAYSDELVLAHEMNRPQQVIRLGKDRLARNPADGQALYYLALTYAHLGRAELAKEHADAAIQLGLLRARCALSPNYIQTPEMTACHTQYNQWHDRTAPPTFEQFVNHSAAALAADEEQQRAATTFFEVACGQSLWLACAVYLQSGIDAAVAAKWEARARVKADQDPWAAWLLLLSAQNSQEPVDPVLVGQYARMSGDVEALMDEAFRIGSTGNTAAQDELLMDIAAVSGPRTVLQVLETFQILPDLPLRDERREALHQILQKAFGMSAVEVAEELRCRRQWPFDDDSLAKADITPTNQGNYRRYHRSPAECPSDSWR